MLIANILLVGLSVLPPHGGRWIEGSFGEAGERLRYRLFVPERYDGSAEVPLVVMLHGCTQTAEDFARGTRMHELAESNGFLVVFAEQRPEAHPQRCWNWYDPAHQRRDAGEPGLIAGMTRRILREYAVDPDRVYLAGVSAGGAMSVNVAASYPELFAAVGVHSGIGFAAARSVPEALRVMREGPPESGWKGEALRALLGEPVRPIPLFVAHGSADAVVNPRNSAGLVTQWVSAMGWSGAADPVREDEAGEAGARAFTRSVLRQRADRRTVLEHWVVEGLGHAWSGGSSEGSYTDATGPDISAEMVRFFLQHRQTARVG